MSGAIPLLPIYAFMAWTGTAFAFFLFTIYLHYMLRSRKEINGRGDPLRWPRDTPLYPQKLALTSPTGGGRSVGIVRSRTKAMEFSFYMLHYYLVILHALLYISLQFCTFSIYSMVTFPYSILFWLLISLFFIQYYIVRELFKVFVVF
jgi:hypothetical protein